MTLLLKSSFFAYEVNVKLSIGLKPTPFLYKCAKMHYTSSQGNAVPEQLLTLKGCHRFDVYFVEF